MHTCERNNAAEVPSCSLGEPLDPGAGASVTETAAFVRERAIKCAHTSSRAHTNTNDAREMCYGLPDVN